jgi:hypothetical protein
MEAILAVITGIGLSAACGFRVFIPLLLMNLAAMYGYLDLAPGFEWIGGQEATIAFAVATFLEVIAYYVPWVDNAMDVISLPIAIIAGTLASASVITGMPSSLKWMLAIIAGGGIAGILQGATAALRVKSSLFTGGIGNLLVSTLELAGSSITALLAIVLPIIGFVVVAVFAIYILLRAVRNFFGKMRPG